MRFYYIISEGTWQVPHNAASDNFGICMDTVVKFIGSTFQYVFKNFLFIFIFALIPSYFFAMSLVTVNIHVLADAVFKDGTLQFPQIFHFISFVNGHGWPYSLVCLAAMAVCLPMLLVSTGRPMRIESRTVKGLAGRFNTNFLSTLIMTVVFFALYELWALITSGTLFGEFCLLSGAAVAVVVPVTYFALLAVFCYVASLLLLWLPCLLMTGYNFMDALNYSNQLYSEKKRGLFLAVFLPAAVAAVAELLVAGVFGPQDIRIPVFIIMELVFIVLLLYYCVLMYVAYFRLTGEERADLRKKY